MLLSIITINKDNAQGLKKTMMSVIAQTCDDYEYIVIDGGSSDGSKSIIKEIEKTLGPRFRWLSEPDTGIYNAMNKGIGLASGAYVQFLNSGDCLACADTVSSIKRELEHNEYPSILYGNMLKVYQDAPTLCDKSFSGQRVTLLGLYSGTLNHSSSIINRSLFAKYGLYDESLKICSDWKWFLDAIVKGGESPMYVDFDVTTFDMTGISENARSRELIREERRSVLETVLPVNVLKDYDEYADDIYLMRRIHRHKTVYCFVRFIERVLFKFEKSSKHRKKVQIWG